MANKTVRNIFGARLLNRNGSLIFCENCDTIVGSINKTGYKYIYVRYLCICGKDGSIEIIKDGHKNFIGDYLNRIPKDYKGVCLCSECDAPMLSMIEDRLQSYSFYVECSCGAKYDTKPSFHKRLGETMKLFEGLNKK